MTHIKKLDKIKIMKLVIFQPDIPQNTGAMVRTCACFDTDIEIIHPCSFPLNDKLLKRSAMDYGSSIKITEHDSWDAFRKSLTSEKRIILLSTKGKIDYTDFIFQSDDCLMVGRESAGVPDEIHNEVDEVVTIPISKLSRSLNVSTAAAIALSEAKRQLKV